jgi:hypothetical protein
MVARYVSRAMTRITCVDGDKGAAHSLRIAKAGHLRHAFDRLAAGLHPLPRDLDPQALHRL